MNKFYILLILHFLFSKPAAVSQYIFQKKYGVGMNSPALIETLGNGYLVAGSTSNSTSGGSDGFVMKIDSTGEVIWSKVYGGSNDEKFLSLSRLRNGNFILSGTTKSFTYSPSDSVNIYLVTIDTTGAVVWSKSIGTNGDDTGHSIKETSDQGFIIAGTADSSGHSTAFLIKTDSMGNIDWDRFYTNSLYDVNVARSVIQTTDGGYAFTGYSTLSSSQNYNNMFIAKTDSTGNVILARHFFNNDSSQSANMGVFGYDIIENNAGNLVAAGGVGAYYFVLSANAYSWLLIEMANSGTIVQSKSFTLNTGDSRCLSLRQSPDGGYILGGYMGNYYLAMIKTDPSITTEWCYHYDQNFLPYAKGYSVKSTSDNGFILAGSYLAGDTIRIVKTLQDGNSGCQQAVPVGPGGVSANRTLDTLSLQWSSATHADTSISEVVSNNINVMTNTVCTNIGIDELIEDNVPVVYPNPANSKVNIILDHGGMVSIINTLGEIMLTENFSKSSRENIEVDVSGFADGIYLIRIDNRVLKLVKQ